MKLFANCLEHNLKISPKSKYHQPQTNLISGIKIRNFLFTCLIYAGRDRVEDTLLCCGHDTLKGRVLGADLNPGSSIFSDVKLERLEGFI